MISVQSTPNLTGVTISGDYDDLYSLVEAFHEITINEYSEKHHKYIGISIRVLGLCYDIRHAYQGDRMVELVDNKMSVYNMKRHSIIVPSTNVYYSCNYLYPEMFFVMLALNELVNLRIKELAKTGSLHKGILDRRVIWDDTIATIRSFQAKFVNCVKETVSPGTFSRWLSLMNSEGTHIEGISDQYVDLLNIKYLWMSKDNRLKNFNYFARRIADYRNDDEHYEIKRMLTRAAREYNCHPSDIRMAGTNYPEQIEW